MNKNNVPNFQDLFNGMKKIQISEELNDFLNCFTQIENHLLWDNATQFTQEDKNNLLSCFNKLTEEDKKNALGYRDKLRNTLLMDAIRTKNEDFCLFMIDLGSDINAFNVNGKSVLILTVNNDLKKVFDKLLDCKVDVNYARYRSDLVGEKVGSSALMFACEDGNAYMVEKLIKAGADINYRNDLKQTALLYSANKKEKGIECFKLLGYS